MSNNSQLESLAAFTIVFVTGVLTSIGMRKYIEKVKRDAVEENTKSIDNQKK